MNFQRNIQTGKTASSRKNSTLISCHRPPESSWWVNPVPGNKCCNFVSRALFRGLEVGRARPSKATLFITTFFCHVLSYHSSHYFNKSVRSFDSLGRRWRSTLVSAHVLEISLPPEMYKYVQICLFLYVFVYKAGYFVRWFKRIKYTSFQIHSAIGSRLQPSREMKSMKRRQSS